MRLLGWIGLAAALSALAAAVSRLVPRDGPRTVTGPVPQWLWDEEFLPPPM